MKVVPALPRIAPTQPNSSQAAIRQPEELYSVEIVTGLPLEFDSLAEEKYPVVIINWVQYLGPPGPFSFLDSRDLLEVLGGLSWQREKGGSLGDPPGP